MNKDEWTAGHHIIHALRERGRTGFANQNISDVMAELGITQEDMRHGIREAFGNLLHAMAIDWEKDHNSDNTPDRYAKMVLFETMNGRYETPPPITNFPNVSNTDQMIIVKNIGVESICSHHHQNVRGKAIIGVLPDPEGKVMGLSKFSRIVRHYARRPQIQEELTVQIADHIQEVLDPRGVIVVIEAEHQCMSCRGVNEHEALTRTIHLVGEFLEAPELRNEFYANLRSL